MIIFFSVLFALVCFCPRLFLYQFFLPPNFLILALNSRSFSQKIGFLNHAAQYTKLGAIMAQSVKGENSNDD